MDAAQLLRDRVSAALWQLEREPLVDVCRRLKCSGLHSGEPQDVDFQLWVSHHCPSSVSIKQSGELQRNHLFSLRMIFRRRGRIATSILLFILMRAPGVQTIKCHVTEYRIRNECCPLCPSGSRVKTDCTKFRTTSCQPCSAGTYMDEPNGLKTCPPCSTCDSEVGLKVKRECRRYEDTVCEPMEGFFCSDPKPGGCGAAQRHRSCKPGQFIRRTGTASTDTDCSDCVAGTFSDGSMSSCQPHTQCEEQNLQLIKAGNTSTDAECGEKKNITAIVIGGVMGFLVLAAIVVVVIFLWKHQRKRLLDICTKKRNPQG